MGKWDSLGQFEQVVLGVIMSTLNAYAVPIQAKVEQLLGKPVRFASIYTALDRLEEKGYVTSRLGGATAERGYQPKRYYTITPSGDMALRHARSRSGF